MTETQEDSISALKEVLAEKLGNVTNAIDSQRRARTQARWGVFAILLLAMCAAATAIIWIFIKYSEVISAITGTQHAERVPLLVAALAGYVAAIILLGIAGYCAVAISRHLG